MLSFSLSTLPQAQLSYKITLVTWLYFSSRCIIVTTMRDVTVPSIPSLSPPELREHLRRERANGVKLQAIGVRFGVSHVAVGHWIAGTRRPSRTVLILAGYLARDHAGEWPMGGNLSVKGGGDGFDVQVTKVGKNKKSG